MKRRIDPQLWAAARMVEKRVARRLARFAHYRTENP